jgi:hypothetical protein
MLEEMGKAGLPLGFLLGADVLPDADCDDRRLAVGVDEDPQPIGKSEALIGNPDLGTQLFERDIAETGLGRD